MTRMEQAFQILQDVFTYSEFRPAQQEVIERLFDDQNVLVLLPTGGGKSLCFQIPALCLDGLTLVISPLISLMKDQVETLKRRGVKAASLDSSLTASEANAVKDSVASRVLKILYVSPERLNNEGFLYLMRGIRISLLAVDESHCISQWGATFRPEYLKIARFAEEQTVERVLCLTATATPQVEKDICKSFHISSNSVFKAPVYRPNLAFQVTTATDFEDKLEKLVPFLRRRKGPAIVYVTLQRQAEEVVIALKAKGILAAVYHAGMKSEERSMVQNSFMSSKDEIVVATIAFGMGIDKADIRQVVHLYLPKTLENFSQEVGRAGRDGLPSDCLMFLSVDDIPTLEGFARGDTCSRRSLELWLHEVSSKAPAEDGSVSFNHYQQAKLYDIRANALSLLYAQLELDFNYIRAVTPFYSIYDIKERNPGDLEHILSDTSEEAKIIRELWRKGPTWCKIDVVEAASASGIERELLARQISKWELNGLIETKATQLQHRYKITGELPKTHEEIGEVAEKLFERMVSREEEAVAKLKKVIEFGTAPNCLATTLASHFGDPDAVPGKSCKKCTFCLTKVAIKFDTQIQTEANAAQLEAILSTCADRDDPRLLARFAFGITSPRLTALGLTRHSLFGSMGTVDFKVLLDAFDKVCAAAGYKVSNPTPVVTSHKRPAGRQWSGVTKKTRR